MDEDYWQDSNCHFEEIKAILRVTRNEVTNSADITLCPASRSFE